MAVNLLVNGKPSTTPQWNLVLEKDEDGNVDINAVNAVNAEDTWCLLRLKPDGTFYRHAYIGENSGFKITKDGRLVESKTD